MYLQELVFTVQTQKGPELLFTKLNKLVFGYYNPENIFLDNEINNFQGDVTDISAHTKPMEGTPLQKQQLEDSKCFLDA